MLMEESIRREIIRLIHLSHEPSHKLNLLLQGIIASAREQDPEVVDCVHALCAFVGDRATALLWLAQGGFLWDAEILTRPIQEGTMRALFLCIAPNGERQRRVEEFYEELSELHDLKQSERVKLVLDRFPHDEDLAQGLSALLLGQEKERALREKWPRKQRHALEQKWSFFEMIADSEKYLESIGVIMPLSTAMHSYGMSSHLIHADEVGLGLVWDRAQRSIAERDALELSHMSRIISDIFSYRMLTCFILCRKYGLSDVPIRNFDAELGTLRAELHKNHQHFCEIRTQAPPNE